MAQKIAPAALRLQTNKHFDAYWFADRTYSAMLHQTLQTKLFLHTVFRQLGTKTALSHVQATPHAIFIQSFFCNPRTMNQRKEKVFVPLMPHTHYMHRFEPFVLLQHNSPRNALFAFSMASHGKQWKPFLQSGSMHALLAMHGSHTQKHYACSEKSVQHVLYALTKSKIVLKASSMQSNNKTFHAKKENGKHSMGRKEVFVNKHSSIRVNKYALHVESVLTKYLQKRVVWKPYKMKRIFTSASFVAHYIALQFEQNRKKPFRFIFQDVLRQCMRTPQLSGIRIAVAGCIGGADKARVETTKYGQTSLHVFAHRIDYHATAASTRKGLLGIKVWMSFKS